MDLQGKSASVKFVPSHGNGAPSHRLRRVYGVTYTGMARRIDGGFAAGEDAPRAAYAKGIAAATFCKTNVAESSGEVVESLRVRRSKALYSGDK